MKKLFFCLFASILLVQNAFAQDGKLGNTSIACSDFNITISAVFASASTTVYVCCGGPFSHGPSMPCSIVTQATYNSFTGGKSSSAQTGNGILVSDLLTGKNISYKNATYIEVTASSSISKNGKDISVKKGRYPIDKAGYIYLELETK